MAHIGRDRPRHRPGRPAPGRRIPGQALCRGANSRFAGNSRSGFTILSRCPITSALSCVAAAFQGGRGASLERARFAQRFSGPGAQRGFSAVELLPAVAVVLAGRDQGGLPRTREHRRQLRPRGAQPVLRDEAAERGLAQDLRKAFDASGLHPVQRVPARPFRSANIAATATISPSIICCRARAAATPPGTTWSPPARPAICARAT